MISTKVLLLRHGEVEEKYHHIFGGRIDMDLSPLGHTQAAALAGHLRRGKLDAIYASPMKRVQQTIAPLLGNGTPTPVVLPDLREMDFGEWTGMRWAEIATRHQMHSSQWLDLLARGAVAGAETEAALRTRLEPCWRQITQNHPGQTVAVACHGGVIRVLLAIALDLPLARLGPFEVDYASVTHLEVRPERTLLKSLNFIPWGQTV